MKILLVSHSRKDPDAGASRVYHLLADGLRVRGHDVVDLHLDDITASGPSRAHVVARRFAFPRLVSNHAATRRPEAFDVVMGSSGMTAPLFRGLRRETGGHGTGGRETGGRGTGGRGTGGRGPLMVNHLHGLAVYDHLANTTQHDLRLAPASLAYRLVTGRKQVSWDEQGVRAADVTVVQNLRDQGYLATRFPDSATRLVPPCLAPALERRVQEPSARDGSEPRRPDLLWFGTWEARKGAHLVSPTLRAVRARHPEVRLVLGGTGRSRDDVVADFDARDRDAVEVLGHVSTEEQARLFRRSAIFLFPSLSEGFGLAPLEAAAFGCVPVLTPTGFGADHVVHGVHGVVVPPSPLHVARGVIRLLEDPPALARMGRRAAELATEFSADAMVDRYEDLFATHPETDRDTDTTTATRREPSRALAQGAAG